MKLGWFLLASMIVALPLMSGCADLRGGSSAPASQTVSDQQLTDDVLERLNQDTITGRMTFNVEAKNGVVTLRGVVYQDSIRARALGVARGTPGAVDVIDGIELR